MANTTGSGKRPIFMLSTQGKSKDQLKAEARDAIRKYQEAQQQEASGSDGHNGALWPHKIKTSSECRLGGEPSKA
jgi:hypothetical protein